MTTQEEKYAKALKDIGAEIGKISHSLDVLSDEEIAEQKEKRLKAFLTKLVTITTIVFSTILGTWELGGFLYAEYQNEKEAKEYYQVAQSVFYEDNNPEVAITFLDKALALNNDSEYRFFKTYIQGLGVVRQLLNLDRPYNKQELDSTYQLIAESKLLKNIDPSKEEPYILLGQLYSALGYNKKALTELKKAIEINPKSSYAHLRYAVELLNEKKVDESRKELELSVKIDNSKWAYLWLGVLEAEINKNFEKAREYYEKALKKDGKFDLALYNIAWSYMKQAKKDYKKAKEFLTTALKINPDYKEAYYAMGMLYGYQDKYEISKVYLNKAIEKDPTYTTAFKWRAIVNGEMKDYDSAINDLTLAIGISPENIDLYTRRAGIYRKIKKYDKAVYDLKYALELKPNSKKTIYYLANLYRDTGQQKKSLELYNDALKMGGNNENILSQRAKLYASSKDYEKSIVDLTEAIKISSYKPERHYFQRASVYESMNDFQNALIDLKEVVKRDKNFSRAYLKLAQIQYQQGNIDAKNTIQKYLELKPQSKQGIILKNKILK